MLLDERLNFIEHFQKKKTNYCKMAVQCLGKRNLASVKKDIIDTPKLFTQHADKTVKSITSLYLPTKDVLNRA